MIAEVLKYLHVFPEWLQTILSTGIGILFVLILIRYIVRELRTSEIKDSLSAARVSWRSTAILLREKATDPLLKSPKFMRVLDYIDVVHLYVLSGCLFVIFLVFVTYSGVAALHLTLTQYVTLVGYGLVCVYFAAVLKAQAGRKLIRLRSSTIESE